jgi:uncharacterized protein with beta-barrel porin domain
MSFKVRLLLGAAVPIVFALPAAAQVQITTATTAPVATATAGTGSTPANIEITATGSVALEDQPNATAVTINSSNTVTNNGTISTNDSNNSTGVRIAPGITGGYSGGGKITVLEDYTRTDTDDDDDDDGPLAQGTGRAGILVDPGGTLNGSINLGPDAGITVEGNDSYGVSVRSILNGDFRQQQLVMNDTGTGAVANGANVTVTGSNSVALDFREDITGNVGIGGTTQALGENSVGVRVLGDVGGEFMVDGTILATGFTSTTATNYLDPDVNNPDTTDDDPAKLDPDDLLVGGPAVEIRGNLARGFLVNGLATGGADPTEDVKDVVQDFNENRTQGAISSVGSAPAVVIQPLDGAAGADLRLGLVRETVRDTLDDDDDDDVNEVIGTFNYDFGLINRGAIRANGQNVGFSSTAMRIAGSADGTHQTIIDGGIFNGNTIAATAVEANALGLNIGAGASTPQLVNAGGAAISATASTQTNHSAIGVRIDAGASVPVVTNNGSISASVDSFDADAIAFQDLSGTVTTFNNNSRLGVIILDDKPDDDVTSGLGRTIALDLSHSASNVTLNQTDTIDNTRIFGDVLFGVGSDRFNLLSGDVFGSVDFGTSGSDVLQINSARLFGDAVFRGANADVSLVGGTMEGAITLNNAAAALSFTGKSTYNGAITSTGGPVSMAVNDSTVNTSGAGTLSLTSMSLANNARLGFVINNARIASNTPIFNVTGVADVGANTVFTPIFEDFTDQAFTLRVLNAATLNLGAPAASLLNVNSPYLFNVELLQPTPNALDLSLRVKTTGELGLNTRQAGAYGAVLDLMETNATVAAAVTSIGTQNEFLRAWTDLLPGSNAAVMQILAANATAAFGATAHRLDLISDKPDAPGGAWVEEFGVYHEGDGSADGYAVSGGGFGVAAGLDLISTGNALIGAYASLESVEVDERNRTSAPLNVAQTTIGLYGGWRSGNFALNAAGGYGFVDLSSDRTVQVGQLADSVKGEWDGSSYNFGARASYTLPMGFLDVKPFIAADYMTLNEDAYEENGNDTSLFPQIALVADSSETTLSTASYGLNFSGNFGSDEAFTFKPELSVGYRNILTWDAPTTTYRFAGNLTGTPFFLDPGQTPEDGIVAGLGLNVESQFLNIKLGYDTEISDSATTHYGSITLRLAFW